MLVDNSASSRPVSSFETSADQDPAAVRQSNRYADPMTLTVAEPSRPVGRAESNRLQACDRAFHDWYRFVLSFPPHLVRDYAARFGLGPQQTVLDPFCGTGTTLVECKKLGIHGVGLEPNPLAHFASAVKVDWAASGRALMGYADTVAALAARTFAAQGVADVDLPLFAERNGACAALRRLPEEQARLLLRNSISPLPLHRTLVLLDAIDKCGASRARRYGRLALAKALVQRIGNLKFGPEVGVGKAKQDAPVLSAWLQNMRAMAGDLDEHQSDARARVLPADSRAVGDVLEPASVDAVITSPPYPNEKDYTRTVRLESVILGFIRSKQELRALKQRLVRSNTRGVYKADTDDLEVATHAAIGEISQAIERRRLELGKTSGFERLYPRVTQLYFGGMRRHLASLRPALKRGAKLAYVVGDQASYLRVMIRTGELLADLAQSLGYRVTGIDLFRTRPSTTTGQQLREEVVLLEWP